MVPSIEICPKINTVISRSITGLHSHLLPPRHALTTSALFAICSTRRDDDGDQDGRHIGKVEKTIPRLPPRPLPMPVTKSKTKARHSPELYAPLYGKTQVCDICSAYKASPRLSTE
jgi:hypothetical protein